MELSQFHPLATGRIPGWKYDHRVHHLGVLNVPSGRVEASDPLVTLGEGLVFSIPRGQYPVQVTLADVSPEQDGSHLRQTYLSLLLAEGVIASVNYLTPDGGQTAPEDRFYGVGVDAGMVAFADADAARVAVTDEEWVDDLFGKLDVFDEPDKPGAAVALAQATLGENLISTPSGWGDGFYPVIGAYDADGKLLSIHIDLQVDEPEGQEPPVAQLPSAAPADAVVVNSAAFVSLMLQLSVWTTAAAALVRGLALAGGYLAPSLGAATTSAVFSVLSLADLTVLALLLAVLIVARHTRAWLAIVLGWLGLLGAVAWSTTQMMMIILDDETNGTPEIGLTPSTDPTSLAVTLAVIVVFLASSALFARAGRRIRPA